MTALLGSTLGHSLERGLDSTLLLMVRVAGATEPVEGPAPEDVKAGWTAFAVFIALALAMVVLGVSLTRQLRKAQAAKDAGVYGDAPEGGDTSDRPEHE